jgi:hypothetical protein
VKLGETQEFASSEEALRAHDYASDEFAHISETPWSNYTKADYTIEQWHAACLIHTHEGKPTSKSECKLPVKTPTGVLNRNGVHAAAAALAGARGGLKGVSADQKKKAGSALKRYYTELDDDLPESLAQGDISHHGVKGMRWGVRKEEAPVGRDSGGRVTSLPKPTQPSLSEKRQRRVDKFLKRADVANTRISELKLANESLQGTRNPAKRYEQRINTQAIKDFERAQKRSLRAAEDVQKGKLLTSTQKKVLIGGVAVTALVGAAVVYKKVGGEGIHAGQQSGAFNSYRLLAQARLRGQKVPFKLNESLSGPMSVKDLLDRVAKPVNPNYRSMGGSMNCRRATYAYELRRRGFDVQATTSAVGWGQSESGVINALTTEGKDFFRSRSVSQAVVETGFSSVARGDTRTNPVKKILLDGLRNDILPSAADKKHYLETGDVSRIVNRTQSSSKKVLEALAQQPNGARGEVLFKFPGFGHSMAYEVVDGVPHIFDSQKATLYNAATKMVESKWDGFTGAEITRLDNVDMDLKFLTRWATNVRGK